MNKKILIQESFKTALSMTLFYWLALWMNWDLPKYGALAIVLVSLSNVRASVDKSLMRMVGTTIGVLVGLLFIALFSQDRWLMMIAMSAYLFVIGYLMQSTRNSYAWYVAGFLPSIVWSSTYMNVDMAFHFAVFRFLETAAGIVIYTIISLVLWPQYEDKVAKRRTSISSRRLNPDYLINALFPVICFVVSFLFWIYTNPPPGSAVPMMTIVFSLMMLYVSMNPLLLLGALFVFSWFLVAPIYFVVMPSLSAEIGLFSLIFTFTFVFSYLGSKSMVLKMGPLILFVMITNITNQQTYSFIGFVNLSIAMLLPLVFMTIIYMLFPIFKTLQFSKTIQ